MASFDSNRSGIVYTNKSYIGFRIDREIFEGAMRLGRLENSLTDGVLLSATYDPALWVNREYVSWLGGPLIQSFGRPQDLISCRVSGAKECQMSNGGLYIIEHNDSGGATAVFIIVKNWWNSPSTTKDVMSVNAISRQRENLLCGVEAARKKSGWWLSDCSLIDEIMFQKIKAQYAS